MKKTNIVTILLSIIGIIILLGFLIIGKCTKIIILDNEGKESSYQVCKGELVGKSGVIEARENASTQELIEKSESIGESYKYFDTNVFNKGYSNSKVVSMIKDHLEPKGMKVTAKDEGIVFVGFNWVIHKFSR